MPGDIVMNRRKFIFASIGTSTIAISGHSCTNRTNPSPGYIAGVTLQEHRDELKSRLYDEYLPFWDNGGYDQKYGGFICNLSKDGIPVDDEKYIWYQGRAVWVYSFLYNNFGHNDKFLEIVRRTRDFMVEQMHIGSGKWGINPMRRGNYHQPRFLMLNILSLDRIKQKYL